MAKPIPLQLNDSSRKPVLGEILQNKEWSFSFKYFNQIDNFGFSGASEALMLKWFVSFLDRLKDLSKSDKDDFLENHVIRQNWRYHSVDWDAYNIPIKRADLEWLDPEIRENDELDFWQFHISKALGRVAGFWWENIFYIVLLDPLHNLQPSKYNGYKVVYCNPLHCQFTSILQQIDSIKNALKSLDHDQLKAMVISLPDPKEYTDGVLIFLDADYAKGLHQAAQKVSIKKIIEDGILQNV